MSGNREQGTGNSGGRAGATVAPRPAARVLQPDNALGALLLALADDELVIGYWDTEWTGIAPMLEEDVATSSVAQDEIGHALAIYGLLEPLTGIDPDSYAYGRSPEAYRFARLIGHARNDWAFTIARRYLYETADAVRLAALERSSYAPLAQLVAKMRREERYHLMHFQTWFERFVQTSGEGRDRFIVSLEQLWPDALDVFSPLDSEEELLREGILPESSTTMRERWQALLTPSIERAGISVVDAEPPAEPRRGGLHPDFAWLHNEMTMVYRQEPGAEW
jgi:ring-1,2-phenylacetyl-CoA epoxidase subunit PaaC